MKHIKIRTVDFNTLKKLIIGSGELIKRMCAMNFLYDINERVSFSVDINNNDGAFVACLLGGNEIKPFKFGVSETYLFQKDVFHKKDIIIEPFVYSNILWLDDNSFCEDVECDIECLRMYRANGYNRTILGKVVLDDNKIVLKLTQMKTNPDFSSLAYVFTRHINDIKIAIEADKNFKLEFIKAVGEGIDIDKMPNISSDNAIELFLGFGIMYFIRDEDLHSSIRDLKHKFYEIIETNSDKIFNKIELIYDGKKWKNLDGLDRFEITLSLDNQI